MYFSVNLYFVLCDRNYNYGYFCVIWKVMVCVWEWGYGVVLWYVFEWYVLWLKDRLDWFILVGGGCGGCVVSGE